MTAFEQLLIDKGYKKHRLNIRTGRYELTDKHLLSALGDLDYRYIHKDDEVLKKIDQGKGIRGKGITPEDRRNIISFGLHECDKPPTLIHPRPRIRVRKIVTLNNKRTEMVQDERYDDAMNLVLNKEGSGDVLKAIFDDSIIFEYDLTNS